MYLLQYDNLAKSKQIQNQHILMDSWTKGVVEHPRC